MMLTMLVIIGVATVLAEGVGQADGTLFERMGPVVPMPTHTWRGLTGSMVQLKDGSLLFALPVLGPSPYTGIVGCKSTDGGRTWGPEFSLQPAIPGTEEIIIPCFLRLPSEEILFFYGVFIHGEMYAQMYVRRSSDEGQTWSHPLCATPFAGGRYTQPDKIFRMSTGRIIIPVEQHGPQGHMISLCYYSDDNGYAWYPSEKPADLGTTTDEPSIVELQDGRLLMIFRTERGYLGQAYSRDGGQTWTDGQLTDLPSPCAPEYLKRIPSTGDLLVIWCHNPEAPALFQQGADQPKVPIGQIPDVALGHVRAPLSSAISRDDGQTWEHIRNIEDNPPGGYGDFGYPGCTFIQEGGQEVAVLNYNALDGIRVTRIGVDWFYGQ